VDDYRAARSRVIPPLPWTTFPPPFSIIAGRIAGCMEEAQASGELPADADPRHMANLIVNCWEGAALRSRLRRDPAPLNSMLDFYFSAVAAAAPVSRINTTTE
jgi:hypothetical protein